MTSVRASSHRAHPARPYRIRSGTGVSDMSAAIVRRSLGRSLPAGRRREQAVAGRSDGHGCVTPDDGPRFPAPTGFGSRRGTMGSGAPVAQWTERGRPKACVGGSSPSGGAPPNLRHWVKPARRQCGSRALRRSARLRSCLPALHAVLRHPTALASARRAGHRSSRRSRGTRNGASRRRCSATWSASHPSPRMPTPRTPTECWTRTSHWPGRSSHTSRADTIGAARRTSAVIGSEVGLATNAMSRSEPSTRRWIVTYHPKRVGSLVPFDTVTGTAAEAAARVPGRSPSPGASLHDPPSEAGFVPGQLRPTACWRRSPKS